MNENTELPTSTSDFLSKLHTLMGGDKDTPFRRALTLSDDIRLGRINPDTVSREDQMMANTARFLSSFDDFAADAERKRRAVARELNSLKSPMQNFANETGSLAHEAQENLVMKLINPLQHVAEACGFIK